MCFQLFKFTKRCLLNWTFVAQFWWPINGIVNFRQIGSTYCFSSQNYFGRHHECRKRTTKHFSANRNTRLKFLIHQFIPTQRKKSDHNYRTKADQNEIQSSLKTGKSNDEWQSIQENRFWEKLEHQLTTFSEASHDVHWDLCEVFMTPRCFLYIIFPNF